MSKSRCSARLRGIQVPDIPLSVHHRGRVRGLAGCAGAVAAGAEVVAAESLPLRRRWRTGVLANIDGVQVTDIHDAVVNPAEPETSCSEDSLFNELTKEDPETSVCENGISREEDTETLVCESDITREEDTPSWIVDAGQADDEARGEGYEADGEAHEEEPCFFIDTVGETYWLDPDDDFPYKDEFARW